MEELAGRLVTLDPAASESLKVIAYFDNLVDGRVSSATLVKSAAVISGAVVGFTGRRGRDLIFGPDGTPDPARSTVVRERALRDGRVWLERDGEEHANDRMVLDRLAIALEITRARTDLVPSRLDSIGVLITVPPTTAEKVIAASALGFTPHDRVRAIAFNEVVARGETSIAAPMSVPGGLVRAAIVRADDHGPPDDQPPRVRVGVGTARSIQTAHESWVHAVVALRLTDEAHPVARADDLGTLAILASAVDLSTDTPDDVLAIRRALDSGWSRESLRAIAYGDSVRGVAAAAGLHHSTVQARLPGLVTTLGYDPTTGLGRARFFAALLLFRLAPGER